MYPRNYNSSNSSSMHRSAPSNGYTVPGANRNNKHTRNSNASTQQIRDYGPYPFATNIEQLTKNNSNFRLALWTGDHFQVTLMSIQPGDDIGLERHPDTDQFIRIEQGKGVVMMGDNPNAPNFQQTVSENDAFVIPAGKWHNLTSIGSVPLKLYSIYAPIQHPFGTVHETKADAMAAEEQQK
ncbi:MAG: cupin domain-containing protein [Cellulosilyticum sp.]|nr:cupin domain-containing protein [Cellulosilyticum sp.]